MADITITAANVQHSGAAQLRTGIANVAIDAGEAVYKLTSGQFALADVNLTATEANVFGVAVSSAAAGQPITIAVADNALAIGATVVAGEAYVVSQTAGGIAPIADLTTDDYISVIGVGVSTSEICLTIKATGAQHA